MGVQIKDARVVMQPIGVILRKRGLEPSGRVQKTVDQEVLRLCEPYVPHDKGDLVRSGTIHTRIGSGQVTYRTPYARRWYYRPAKFKGAPKRGNYWFERMKKEGGRDKILKAAAAVAGAKER
jgi:hypothetical protein|nr:MAG TPA: Minor capsid protein [Caudoviricetes sp.]